MDGMYGTLDAELEVQRTLFFGGEMKCIGTKAKDADLWILIREVVRNAPGRKNNTCLYTQGMPGDRNEALRPVVHIKFNQAGDWRETGAYNSVRLAGTGAGTKQHAKCPRLRLEIGTRWSRPPSLA